MKIKALELMAINEAIAGLRDKKLPVKLSYAIARNERKIQTELETINTQRLNLARQYAEKDKDGKPVINEEKQVFVFTAENQAQMNREYAELLNTEIDVDFHKTVEDVLELCGTGSYDALTLKEVSLISFMISD